MSPADRIREQNEQDPSRVAHTRQEAGSNGFLAVSPAMRILQLNVEGLSVAKRSIIRNVAERHNVNVSCLQKTGVDADCAGCFSISGFDLISYTLHAKHGRALYTRNDLIDVSSQLSTSHCDVVKIGGYNIANVYKPPAEPWEDINPLPFQPHPAIYMADFNSHHPDWGYDTPNNNGNMQLVWASCSDLALVHGPKQRGTFRSAHRERDFSPDLCWYFMGFQHKHPPHISLGSMLLSHRILLSSVG